MADDSWTNFTLSADDGPPILKDRINNRVHLVEKSPLEIYKLFIPDEIIDLLVVETNRFAQSFMENNKISKKSRTKKWVDTDAEEMKKFIGIQLLLGLVHFPKIFLYWSNDEMYGNEMIKKTMTRDRYLLLMKFWHFCNNDEDPKTNRLFKIQELLNIFNLNCASAVTPGTKIVIDESMVPWRGRLVFRVYNKSKSNPYGVKLYKVCTTSGYTLKIDIYGGKKMHDVKEDIGKTHSLVLKLLNGYLNQNRILYCDNFYNSIPLAEDLLNRNTYVCGTLRKDRVGIPYQILSQKLQRGEIVAYSRENIKLIKWKDKRDVLMITTEKEHDILLYDSGKRNKKGEMTKKPKVILDYNEAKKGVDLSDQMASYYDSRRKTIKWYKKIALELITGTGVVNAWVVYNDLNNKKMHILDFTESIIKDLLNNHNDDLPQNKGRRSKHTLVKGDRRRRCVGCYDNIRKFGKKPRSASRMAPRVSTYCEKCENQPALCLSCFNQCHKNC